MPQSSRDRDRERRHRAHRSTDSGADLLPRSQSPSRPKRTRRRDEEDEEERRRRRRERRREERRIAEREERRESRRTEGHGLSMASLAALDALNNATEERPARVKVKKVREVIIDDDEDEEERRREERRRRKKEDLRRRREEERDQHHAREKRRVISGTVLERGSGRDENKEGREWRLRERGGAASEAFSDEDKRKKRRKLICEWGHGIKKHA